MLTIDGRTGGVQLLRTALALSAVTGTPFELVDVRAERPSPGLKPQHLAAIRLVADVCDAEVDGATADSESVTFRPGPVRADPRRVDVGTAGSVTLLFDAVLPLATRFESPFELTAVGGTDVKWAPTVGYHDRVKCPLLRRSGLEADVSVGRTGFYPAGGGEATLRVEPSSLAPLDLVKRGALGRVEVRSKASVGLAERDVAERQAGRAEGLLADRDLPVEVASVEYVESRSPGSSLLLRAVYEGSLAGFDALGERGKPAEAVADEAVEAFLAFHAGAGVVDPHMGDQLLAVLGLAGGVVRAPRQTDHVRSNAALVRRFGFDLRVAPLADGTARVESRG